jgi:plastocyanin
MAAPTFSIVLVAVMGLAAIHAADVEGSIVIQRRLTKRSVTAPASAYQRGVTVALGSDANDDPLAFERSQVVVYLEGQLGSKPVTATMEQKNRRFLPETLVVPVGSEVSFPNLDPIFHNVFSLSKPKTFDLGNYPKNQTRTVIFSKPGVVFVHCRLHPNMGAAIVVSPNQWSAKAEATGRFVLPHVPPGRYTIVAWHKVAGFFRQTVQVGDPRSPPVQFFIPLDESSLAKAVAQR